MTVPLRVGIVGAGVISKQYFESLERFSSLKLVAVADINEARAAEVAATRGVEARSVGGLLASDDVDAVLNLTIPAAHVGQGPHLRLRAGPQARRRAGAARAYHHRARHALGCEG